MKKYYQRLKSQLKKIRNLIHKTALHGNTHARILNVEIPVLLHAKHVIIQNAGNIPVVTNILAGAQHATPVRKVVPNKHAMRHVAPVTPIVDKTLVQIPVGVLADPHVQDGHVTGHVKQPFSFSFPKIF